MEAKISQGRPKVLPATQNASQKSSGTEIRKLGRTKFKFGQSISRKIIKIVATRCHILRLKCIKFDFGWGSDPDPAGGAHSAPQTLAGFKGTSNGRGIRGREKGREERKAEEGRGMEGVG